MSTTIIRSIEVALETTYQNPDANGVPTTTGLTFVPMAFELASAPTELGGTLPVDEDGTAHNGSFGLPPEASGSYVGGVKTRSMTGDVSLACEIRGYGGGNGVVADANAMPLTRIWGSFSHVVDPGGAEITPLTGSLDGKEITVTTGTTLAPGELVVAQLDGCVVYNRVTDVTVGANDTVVFELAWPRQITTSDRLQRGLQFQFRTGANTGAVGDTVCIRYKTTKGTMVAFGCRLRDLTVAGSETGRLLASHVLQSDYITAVIESSDQAVADAERFAAAPANLLGTDLLVSTDNVLGASAPVSAASRRPSWEYKSDWEFKVSAVLEHVGAGCNRRSAQLDLVRYSEITFKYLSKAPYKADESDYGSPVQRAITAGGGPINDGTTKLNGWGFSIPAAHLTALANLTLGGEIHQQVRTYKAGLYHGDSPDTGVNVVMYLGGT